MFAVLGRLLIRLGSAIALLTMLAAVPAGLAIFIGWPLPDHMPSSDELTSFLTRGIGDHTIIDGLAILLWLVWALFTMAVGVEAAAAIRGVQAPRLRGLGPVQGLASILVTGLTASVIAGSALVPATAATIFGPPTAATAASSPSTVVQASPDRPVLLTTATSVASPRLHTVGTVTLVIDGCGYEHTVVKNESLWRIAEMCLGDPRRWPEIWELNKHKYWPHVSGSKNFTDPDVIFPGWVLDLPASAAPPPQTTPLPPPIEPSTPPQTPAPSASASPSAQASTTAIPTTVPSAPATAGSEDGVVELIPTPAGSLSPSASASPSPSTSVTSSTTDSVPEASPTAAEDGVLDGVSLPGGWISAALGAALVAAVAWVWKRRRQRYIPTPIGYPESETDPSLAPPLAARTLIRQTLRRANPEALAEPTSGPTVRQFTTAEVKPALPDTGPSGTELAGASTLPLIAGMGLAGDGAHDAARGLLVAVLASGHPDDPDAQGRVIVPAATLATLIGVSAVDLGPMSRLTIAASFTDALGLVEEEIIRRSRIVAEAHVADVNALRTGDAFAEPLPQLLLLADAPEPASQARLLTAIGLGERLHIGAALLGTWPPGTTLTVNTDGTTTGGTGQRLAVLSADAAADTIAMLREAHGDTIAAPAEHIPGLPATTVPSNVDAQPLRLGGEAAPAPPASRVQVRILGPAAVLDTTGEPASKLRAKSVELLVYLALQRKGAPLDQIMEAIWPDATMRRASERLSTCVANLRRVIRSAAHGDEPAPDQPRLEPVINTGGHYQLDPAIVTVDWWTVLDETSRVASASNDQGKLAHLQAAIAALHGPLADGADYEWIDTDREHVRRTQIRLYAQAADLLTPTDPHQARTLLDTACDIDPLSEELARRAIQAAATLGDIDGIRHRLDTIRRDLDEAGTEFVTDIEQLAATLIKQVHHAQREDN